MKDDILDVKFPFPIGFEMTALEPAYEEVGGKATDQSFNRSQLIGTAIAEVLNVHPSYSGKYPPAYKRYTDVHCIEIGSPVFTSGNDLFDFHMIVNKEFAKYGCHRQLRDITVCGGNHLHFELDNLNWCRKIVRDVANRPYIPWVFTHPDDSVSCDNVWGSKELKCSLTTAKKIRSDRSQYVYNAPCHLAHEWLLTSNRNASSYIRDLAYKSELGHNKDNFFSIDVRPSAKPYGTDKLHRKALVFQWRCVEAPLDSMEFLDQLLFFILYTQWVKSQPLAAPVKIGTKKDLQKLKPRDCVIEFNKLLLKIGLKPSTYEKYVRRNLYPRWKLNRRRV